MTFAKAAAIRHSRDLPQDWRQAQSRKGFGRQVQKKHCLFMPAWEERLLARLPRSRQLVADKGRASEVGTEDSREQAESQPWGSPSQRRNSAKTEKQARRNGWNPVRTS